MRIENTQLLISMIELRPTISVSIKKPKILIKTKYLMAAVEIVLYKLEQQKSLAFNRLKKIAFKHHSCITLSYTLKRDALHQVNYGVGPAVIVKNIIIIICIKKVQLQ